MPNFTVETTYHQPVYRQRTYDAQTIEEACRLATEDQIWSNEASDIDSSQEISVSGIWQADAAYRAPALPIPAEFRAPIERKASHFEVLLGILKILAHVDNLEAPDLPYWRPRAEVAIAKAEAILAGEPDPVGDADSLANRTHVLLQLEEMRVRDELAPIIATDPALTSLMIDAITDADIHAACLLVATQTDLSEERGAAEFRAALAAIREAQHRLAISA
jgi:hypothetical protein